MSIKFKKILCPVDFSETSKIALEYALELASHFDSELILFHVIDIQFLSPYVVTEIPNIIPGLDQIRENVDGEMNALTNQCRQKLPDCNVRSKIVQGMAFVSIVEAARNEGVDIIIMGTHGRSGLSHLLIGSVAERVVRSAHCPVLTVKHPDREPKVP